MRLAFIGSMNDEVIIMEELACDLLECLKALYPSSVCERYGIEWQETMPATLEKIAASRGCFNKAESLDLKKAADILTDDFRGGRLGRMTLERPDTQGE